MLLATEWHPWFSYEWWADIGVPTIGAIGAVAVGAGAVFVAFQSNRIAAAAGRREDATNLASRVAEDRRARGDFAQIVAAWNRAEVRERIRGYVPDRKGKAASVLRDEAELQATLVGQYADELTRTLNDRLSRVPKGADATSEGQALALLWYHYSRPAIRSWVADPEEWWAGEQEDRVSLQAMRDLQPDSTKS